MPKLVKRLASQVGDEGMAIALLKKRGHLDSKGKLTAEGKKRQAMGRSGRAKSRAAKASGGKASDYKYSRKTNTARRK